MTPAIYARQLSATGQTIGLRRKVNGAVVSEASGLRARVTRLEPEELVGGFTPKSRKAIVLAADVAASGFDLPFKTGVDQMITPDGTFTITDVDATTRVHAGVLLAYELKGG